MGYKIIALIGEAGSGKDSIMQRTLATYPFLHEIISCTTRPKRDTEIEGVNYFYMTPEAFGKKVLDGEMLECTVFNDWFYGTSYESLRSDVINIGVFNPAGIESLIQNLNVQVQVYKVETSSKNRLLRQLNREKNPNVDEIIRRYKADKEDFFDLDFKYIPLINEQSKDLDSCSMRIISDIINKKIFLDEKPKSCD